VSWLRQPCGSEPPHWPALAGHADLSPDMTSPLPQASLEATVLERGGKYFDWLAGGVDHSLPGNGGPTCSSFRSSNRWIWETVLFTAFSLSIGWWARNRQERVTKEAAVQAKREWRRNIWVQIGLVSHTLILGIQLGYKVTSRQLVYILSPCHAVTALQVYLLAAPPSPSNSIVFQTHLGLLNGAVLALLFPVLDTYTMPGEVELFWTQHIAMLLVPILLVAAQDQSESYSAPLVGSFNAALLSYAVFFLYHLLILQPAALLTRVNLDFIMCPAPNDPFYGPNYLFHHVWIQAVVIVGVSQAFSLILTKLSSKPKLE